MMSTIIRSTTLIGLFTGSCALELPFGLGTSVRGANVANLDLIPGVYPQKNMPADYGFDPLNLAENDLNIASAWDKNRDKDMIVADYRDAELRHGRLAMLAALAWPIQELASPTISKLVSAKTLLSDGRSPSVLNGEIGAGPIPFFLFGVAIGIGAIDYKSLKLKEEAGKDWLPGDYGFDPLNLLKGASPLQIKDMQAKEINNGRLAMLAVTTYVIQEALSGEPITALSEQLFTPIIYYPWFQQLLTDSFGVASFR